MGFALRAIFSGSPFLTDCLLAEPDVLRQIHEQGVGAARAALMAELAGLPLGERGRLASGLRRARRRLALLVALADLAGLFTLEETSETLTAFADTALAKAVQHLLVDAARRGELALVDRDDPERASGLIVLGMGKYGARELNYSSDVDLIVLFEKEGLPARASDGPWRSPRA